MPTGYLLCGTPRTGSTLLCGLLASTGVLGRPESYFREPDERVWARRLGVPVVEGRVDDYAGFVSAVRTAATTCNGVFAARIMWGSLPRILDGLRTSSGASDLAVLEAALGPLAFVFLRRQDVISQAVSWARAEQTGFWQDGDTATRPAEQDLEQLASLVRTVREHNAAWRSWFEGEGITPVEVTYEGLVRDPRATVESIAAPLHVGVPRAWQPVTPHRKQADELNEAWADAVRAAARREGG